jgi:adenosine/AMP kinase
VRGIISVVDCKDPVGVEDEDGAKEERAVVLRFGYKV